MVPHGISSSERVLLLPLRGFPLFPAGELLRPPCCIFSVLEVCLKMFLFALGRLELSDELEELPLPRWRLKILLDRLSPRFISIPLGFDILEELLLPRWRLKMLLDLLSPRFIPIPLGFDIDFLRCLRLRLFIRDLRRCVRAGGGT